MKTVETYLHKQSKPFWVALGIVLVVMFGLVDYLTGTFSFSIFYFIPIFAVTWLAGQRQGVLVFAVAVFVSVWVDMQWLNGDPSFAQIGRIAGELGSLLVVTLLVTYLKRLVDDQKLLTRIDQTTGTANERYFTEVASREICRAKRSACPLTVAYIELSIPRRTDDLFGEKINKNHLSALASTLRNSVRTTDTVARVQMGGFAVLLPETGSKSAKVVLDKIKERTQEMTSDQDLSMSVKIGAVTFFTPPESVDEMLLKTNSLIHAVKTSRRPIITHEVGVASMPKK